MLWEGLCKAFEELYDSRGRGYELSELKTLQDVKEENEDDQAYVLSLYQGFFDHFNFGHCTHQQESVIANLRLTWPSTAESLDCNTRCFELFIISNHDPKDSKLSWWWQDIQISVTLPRTRKVNFMAAPKVEITEQEVDMPHLKQDCSDSSSISDEEDLDQFCKFLEGRDRVQYQFAYSTCFDFKSSCLPTSRFRRNSPSVPLSTLLGGNKLRDNDKLLLSFLLVNTLWQYYDSGWMSEDWNNDTVHFMFDEKPSNSKNVIIHEPFLKTQFGNSSSSDLVQGLSEPRSGKSSQKRKERSLEHAKRLRTHKYPQLLALGIMLIEIELDMKFEDFPRRDDCIDLDMINTRHTIANDLITNKEFWPREDIRVAVRQIIEICVKPDTEILCAANTLRESWLKEVVRPLEALLNNACPGQKSREVDPISIEDSPPQVRQAEKGLVYPTDSAVQSAATERGFPYSVGHKTMIKPETYVLSSSIFLSNCE
jgi:hypothetical protein